MLDPIPWFIGGEAEHSAETARSIAWNATQGRTGVSRAGDLAVRATSVASNRVRVMPGGGCVESTYAGAPLQSYIVRNTAAVDVPVAANTSSGVVTRYVGVQVTDPQYLGNPPANKKDGPYNSIVSLNRLPGPGEHPFLLLATVRLPAKTSAVTNAMIKDARVLLNPRRGEVVLPRPVLLGDLKGYSHVLRHVLDDNNLRAEEFPDSQRGGRWDVAVPVWATSMTIEAQINGVVYDGSKSAWGGWYISVSGNGYSINTQDFGFDVAEDPDANKFYRYKTNWLLAETLPVNAKLRGQTCAFRTLAFLDRGARSGSGGVALDSRSGLLLRVTFHEVPDSEFLESIK